MNLIIKFRKILLCLLFFLILGAIPRQAQALTVQQTLAQSQAGDRVYEVSGGVFYAYGGSCPPSGCEIAEPPAPYGWRLLGFDDSSWGSAVDAYTQSNANDWWCVQLPSNCRPIGQTPGIYTPGDPDQITGPSGFADRETLLFRKAYTISPPAGHRTTQVMLEIWSDNNGWAYAGDSSSYSLVGTAGLNSFAMIDITAITLAGFGDTQTFAKEIAIQVSNDDQGAGNPVGVQYRVKATYEVIPITLSGKVTDSSGNPLVNQTINTGQACNIGTATTGADGKYSFPNISLGQSFCLRPPAVAGYISPPNPASYECQTAGQSLGTVPCGGGGGTTLDQPTDDAYNFVYTPTPTPTPGAPTITSLQIGNNPNRDPGFTSTLKGSGRQTSEQGKGWYNPMSIRLDVTPGTNQNSNYYVTFYDKANPSGQLTNKTTFLQDARAMISSNPANGFLLRYDRNLNKYYIWDNNQWLLLPHTVKDSSSNPLAFAEAVSGGTNFANWKITLYSLFGSKNMFTAAYVEDSSATPLADFVDDCAASGTRCQLLTP